MNKLEKYLLECCETTVIDGNLQAIRKTTLLPIPFHYFKSGLKLNWQDKKYRWQEYEKSGFGYFVAEAKQPKPKGSIFMMVVGPTAETADLFYKDTNLRPRYDLIEPGTKGDFTVVGHEDKVYRWRDWKGTGWGHFVAEDK